MNYYNVGIIMVLILLVPHDHFAALVAGVIQFYPYLPARPHELTRHESHPPGVAGVRGRPWRVLPIVKEGEMEKDPDSPDADGRRFQMQGASKILMMCWPTHTLFLLLYYVTQ